MKYLDTSMMGSYNIDCELIRDNGDGTVDIKYQDLFSEEITEQTVNIDRVTWEFKDQFTGPMIEVSTAENVVVFNDPIVVGYYPRKTEVTLDGGCFFVIEFEYDFGMTDMVVFDEGQNTFLNIDSSMTDEQIVRRIVEFDLAHAFNHPQEDPNYDHVHWALYGNLKNRVEKVIDPTEVVPTVT